MNIDFKDSLMIDEAIAVGIEVIDFRLIVNDVIA